MLCSLSAASFPMPDEIASVLRFPFTTYATPLATNIVPNVAINGGNLNFPTKVPLINPTIRQHTMVIRIADGAEIPPVIRVAEIIALIPTTELMDKSMFPVINT